jgi:hypothetical protein
MGDIHRTHKGDDKCLQNSAWKPARKRHLGGTSVDRRTILKWTPKKKLIVDMHWMNVAKDKVKGKSACEHSSESSGSMRGREYVEQRRILFNRHG